MEKELKQWWKKDSGLQNLTDEELVEPKQITLQLTDDETMEIFDALALVCSNEANLPNCDILKVIDFKCAVCLRTLFVKIIEKKEEPEVQVTFNTTKQRLSQKKDILKSLLK
jgi:hypothetical protein